jgi:hypothetical protein
MTDAALTVLADRLASYAGAAVLGGDVPRGCRRATAVVTMLSSHRPLIKVIYAGWAGR